jgi:hypothetical protein
MTRLKAPQSAKVFVVGYNFAVPYMANTVNYERFIDSLFNRNGESCEAFYEEMTNMTPTRTRSNIKWFSRKLAKAGCDSVIETNVICYGTRKKNCLGLPKHQGGKELGIKIFLNLVKEIRPKAIVVYGKGACEEFGRALELSSPRLYPPNRKNKFVRVKLADGTHVFVIPSLAEPGFSNWPKKPLESFCNWADEYLDEVASRVARACAG